MLVHRRAGADHRGTKAASEYFNIKFGWLLASAGHGVANAILRSSRFACSCRTSAAAMGFGGRCLWSASGAELTLVRVRPEARMTCSV